MERYIPSSLTSNRINTIFKNVVATKRSQKTIRCVLFKKENGFPQDSRPIYFDEDALNDNKSKIEYLLGQLKDIHEKKTATTPQTATILYNNQTWCEDTNTLLSFLHLAVAAKLISPIDAKTSSLTFQDTFYPTISMTDPNFDDWQSEHKPKILKMIKEKNSGQEPADD